MNLNIVKYFTIIWMYVNIIMWIWIMNEFKSCMNLKLKYSNIIVIYIFQMVSAGLS
jgi:hypothetical protein